MGAVAVARKGAVFSNQTRAEYATAAQKEQWRRSLYLFVRESWDVLEPGTPPEWNWHIEQLCTHVQMLLEGWLVANGHAPANGNARQRSIRARVMRSWALHGLTFKEQELLVQNAIFNLPPGTLKSRVVMVCAVAWMWLHCPTWTVCAISSVDDNVTRDSNMCRELVESPWYRETFGVTWKIHQRKNSVQNWETTAGGKRKSRTLNSGFTGVRCDAIFLDDPDDAHKVFSEAKRKDTQWKWKRSIRNRLNHLNRSLRIAIQQRVHVDDWTAAQIAKGIWSRDRRKGWMWVVWPLRYARGPAQAPTTSPFGFIDPRRVANDNLHAARFPDEVIADELVDLGPDGFAAQYDQNPEELDGGMVKRSFVQFFRFEGEPLTERERPWGCGLKTTIIPQPAKDVDQIVEVSKEPAFVLRKVNGRWDLDQTIISVDTSGGSVGVAGSATSIGAIGKKGSMHFVMDDRTDHYGPLEMFDAILNAVADWEADECVIENKAMGLTRIAELEAALKKGVVGRITGKTIHCKVTGYDPKGESKEQRAMATLPIWRACNVYVLDGAAWLYPKTTATGKTVDYGFIGEICGFPKVPKNDRMDMMSQALKHLRTTENPKDAWRAMSRGLSR